MCTSKGRKKSQADTWQVISKNEENLRQRYTNNASLPARGRSPSFNSRPTLSPTPSADSLSLLSGKREAQRHGTRSSCVRVTRPEQVKRTFLYVLNIAISFYLMLVIMVSFVRFACNQTIITPKQTYNSWVCPSLSQLYKLQAHVELWETAAHRGCVGRRCFRAFFLAQHNTLRRVFRRRKGDGLSLTHSDSTRQRSGFYRRIIAHVI